MKSASLEFFIIEHVEKLSQNQIDAAETRLYVTCWSLSPEQHVYSNPAKVPKGTQAGRQLDEELLQKMNAAMGMFSGSAGMLEAPRKTLTKCCG
jgi:hypothetical protein